MDELEIVIDVMDSFSDELNELIADLEAADVVAEDVDNITIDLDVHGFDELFAAMMGLESLPNQQTSEVDIDVDGMGQLLAARAAMTGLGGGGNVDIGAMNAAMGGARGDSADSFELANLRMSDLHNVLARLIPLIFVFIGALGPVIGALGALAAAAVGAAGALGAIGGLGLLGMTMGMEGDALENLETIAQDIQDDFMDAFGPLARELAPLFRDALGGLELFFDELAARGSVLTAFTDDARGFGQFIIDTVPNVLASLVRFADAMGPVFAMIGEGLRDINLLEILANLLADSIPYLVVFTREVIRLVSLLGPMTIGFLKVATAATALLRTIISIITLGGRLNEMLGTGIGAVLALATAYGILSSSIWASLLPAIQSALASLSVYATAAYQTAVANGVLAAASEILSVGLMGVASTAFYAVIALSALTVGVYALGAVVGTVFGAAATDIDGATQSLREFKDVNDSIGNIGPDGGPRSNVFQFRPNQTRQPTIINADNVSEGKRVENTRSFRDGAARNADMR